MKKNHSIMLAILIAGLILENARSYLDLRLASSFQFYVYTIALHGMMIWSIVKIGKIRPLEPKAARAIIPSFLSVFGAFILALICIGLLRELTEWLAPTMHQQLVETQENAPQVGESSIMSNFHRMIALPVLEEIIFRVGILGGLMEFMKRPAAIMVASLIFALAHFAIYPPTAWIGVFIIGIFLALTYLMLGLQWAIMLHILHNTTELSLKGILFFPSEFMSIIFFTVSLVGISLFIHRVIRYRKVVFQ